MTIARWQADATQATASPRWVEEPLRESAVQTQPGYSSTVTVGKEARGGREPEARWRNGVLIFSVSPPSPGVFAPEAGWRAEGPR